MQRDDFGADENRYLKGKRWLGFAARRRRQNGTRAGLGYLLHPRVSSQHPSFTSASTVQPQKRFEALYDAALFDVQHDYQLGAKF